MSNKTAVFASYKTTVIHTVYCEARLNFMNCYLYGVHSWEIDYKLILFSDKDWFLLGGYVNSWKNRLPMSVHKVPLQVCGMLCVQWWLWGPFCFWDNKFTLTCYSHSNTIFWTPIQLWDNLCCFSSVVQLFALQTIHCLQSAFGAHNKQKADKDYCLLGHDTKFTCNFLACFRGACILHLQRNQLEQVVRRTDHTTLANNGQATVVAS